MSEPAPEPAAARPRRRLDRRSSPGPAPKQPLDEKVLVAPSLPIGHQLLERLAREGHPWMNLRVETVRTLAHGLVGADLAREGQRLLSRAQALALVEQACAEALAATSYFGPLRGLPGFHRAVQPHVRRAARRGDLAGRPAARRPSPTPASAGSSRRSSRATTTALGDGRLRRRGRGPAPRGRGRRGRPASESRSYLLPEDLELAAVERARSRAARRGAPRRLLASEPPADWTRNAREAPRSSAPSARRTRSGRSSAASSPSGIPFDEVEILHTDPSTYPALAWELSREHDVPCTFAGGVAAPFTPARAGGPGLSALDRRRASRPTSCAERSPPER